MTEREGRQLPSVSEPEHARDPRVAKAMELLQQGIEGILDSEGFASYLRLLSRFHSYSAMNTLLIAHQKPEATHIAGFRKWQEMGRFVRKDEKAIKIFVPYFKKKTDPASGEEETVLTSFGIGNVFDVSQTEGKPLPEPPPVLELGSESENAAAIYVSLLDVLNADGVTVRREVLKANGVYYPARKEIAINETLQGDQATKTLTHEAAHHMAGHRGWAEREDAETVAESVAFVVLHHFGIPTGQYSFPYVAGWAGNKEVLQRNLTAIQKTSHDLIEKLEQVLARKQPAE